MKKTFILSAFLITMFGCSVFPGTQSGKLAISASFKNSNFVIKEIPANTTSISVSVSGVGLDKPLSSVLTTEKTIKYLDVPIGEKTVTAKARDKENLILAEASEVITILPQKLNTVTLTLIPKLGLGSAVKPVPTDLPVPTATAITEPTTNPSVPASATTNIPDTSSTAVAGSAPPVQPPQDSGSGGGGSSNTSPPPVISVDVEIVNVEVSPSPSPSSSAVN